jgi:hypothetical protein
MGNTWRFCGKTMEEQWEQVTWTFGKRLEIGTDVRYWHATSQLQDLASCEEKLYSVLLVYYSLFITTFCISISEINQ